MLLYVKKYSTNISTLCIRTTSSILIYQLFLIWLQICPIITLCLFLKKSMFLTKTIRRFFELDTCYDEGELESLIHNQYNDHSNQHQHNNSSNSSYSYKSNINDILSSFNNGVSEGSKEPTTVVDAGDATAWIR
jgi:hypothetical protein